MSQNKFRVEVTLTAQTTYEVEIEADSEEEAEEEACNRWRELSDDDFQVADPSFETDSEQTEWVCRECSESITEEQSRETDQLCVKCSEEAEK